MEELLRISTEGVNRYFTTLSQFGFKDYKSIYRLLALLFIEEFFDDFEDFISEKDYKVLIDAIYCLSGSTCMIDYVKQNNEDTLFHKTIYGNLTPRLDEEGTLRFTEDTITRIVETN